MATLTSTKAGVWSDPTVWGGAVPAAGDDVVVNHDVEYDLNDEATLLNLITINANGVLRHKEDVQTAIHVWQVTIAGGTYQMGPLSKHIIYRKGTATYTTTGRIYMNTTNYGKLLLSGSRLDLFTSLAASPSIGDAYLDVSDSSKLGYGDNIHVYKDNRNIMDDQDEGFWVNYVETGKVWIRRFVGPSCTTTAQANAGATEIYVDNARKFFETDRVIADNSKIVFDIQSIDLSENKLVLASPLSATIAAGTMLYETGVEKSHDSDSEVRVNCMTLQSAISANTTNIVQISNASRLSVGDTLYIEDTHWSGTSRYEGTFATVASINGNDVTLSNMYRRNYQTVTNLTNFDRNIESGAIAVLLNFDCVVEADLTPGPYIDVADTSNSNRQVVIENVLLHKLGGSSSATYRGLSLRGYFNGTAGGTCIVQRNALLSCNQKADGEGMYFYAAYYGIRPIRCNFIWGAYSGLRMYGCFQGGRVFGNISSFAGYNNFRIEYIVHGMKFAYNLGTASQNYAYMFAASYHERPNSMRSDGWEIYADSNISRFAVFPFYFTETATGLRYSLNRFSFYKPHYTPNHPLYCNGFLYVLNSEIVGQLTTTTYDNSSDYNHFGTSTSVNNGLVSLNHNFNGDTIVYTGRAIFYLDIDSGKQVWRMSKRNTTYWSGLVGSCYLTKGSKATFTGQIMVATNYNGSTPRVRWYSPFNLAMQSQDVPNYIKGVWLPYLVEVTAQRNGFYFFVIETNANDTDVWMTNPVLYVDGYELRQSTIDSANQARLKERVVFDREITPSDSYGIKLMGARFGG
ncbi:MAG TPA: G8 domain-containing protein [Mesotoga sp.]|nr:G8 domain-containing protein [Mesotoga sp.]